MKKTTHNLVGCRCPEGSDIQFCFGHDVDVPTSPILEESWKSIRKQTVEELCAVVDALRNAPHKYRQMLAGAIKGNVISNLERLEKVYASKQQQIGQLKSEIDWLDKKLASQKAELIGAVREYAVNALALHEPTHGAPLIGNWINIEDLLAFLEGKEEECLKD